jgi:hypothetical protein
MYTVPSDFDVAPYNLPNLDKVANSFADYTNQFEKNALQKTLGTTFYNALTAGVQALPPDWNNQTAFALDALVCYGIDIYKSLIGPNQNVVPGSDGAKWEKQPDNRWLHLKIGEMYTIDNGSTEEWVGLKKLLIPFVHASWLRDSINDSVNATGVTQAVSENSKQVGSGIRYGRSMNDYSRLAGKYKRHEKNNLYRYLYTNSETFDDVVVNLSDVTDFADYLVKYFKGGKMIDLFDF